MASLQKKEETNWNRACRLLLEGGRDMLMQYLQNFLSSNNYPSLDSFLTIHKGILTSPAMKRHIHPPQLNILFPAIGSTRTDEWDITLAAAVIHNCIQNKTPAQWNSLKKVRDLRNLVYGHVDKMKMNDADFTQNWTDICSVLTQAATDFGLTQQQFDLQSKSDRISKEVIVDGDELRKELFAWNQSDILQGQDDIKAVILQGIEKQKESATELKVDIKTQREEQREASNEIKEDVRKLMKELRETSLDLKAEVRKMTKKQSEVSSDIKSEIRKGTREQKEVSSEIKAAIRKGTKEQKEVSSEIKAEVRKGTKEQSEASSEIKAEVRKGTKEQREASSEIKTEIRKGTKKQREASSDIKNVVDEGRKNNEHSLEKVRVQIEQIHTGLLNKVKSTQKSECQFEPTQGTSQSYLDNCARSGSSNDLPSVHKRKVSKMSEGQTARRKFTKTIGGLRTSTSSVTKQIVKSEHQATAKLPPELHTLQSDLVKYYRKNQIRSPLVVHSPSSQADIDDIYAKPQLVLVDHWALSKKSTKEKKIAFKDIFQRSSDDCQHIYISGEAGVGKTSLCKHLIASWCRAHTQEPVTDDQDTVSTMKQFDFLFYVTLRHAKDQYEINEMIVSQILGQILKTSSVLNKKRDEFLEELFEEYSERCLIVLDGLDEWTAPRDSHLPSVSNGLPGRSLLMNYTIVTTSRPWKLTALRLQDTEIDKKIDLRGVEDVDGFGEKLLNIYNKQHDGHKTYQDFETQLINEGLSKMKDIPILLKQLLCLWYNDHPFGKSTTDVYTNMLEVLFERAEMRENVTELKVHSDCSSIKFVSLPNCIKKGGYCMKYKAVLMLMGKLAFETMFSNDNTTQLVFDLLEAEDHDIHKKDISTFVTFGILTQSVVPDMVRHRESLSFLHKTFHEYFAALYLSVNHSSISDLDIRVRQKCQSLKNLFETRDMFKFLSGMCPPLMLTLSGGLMEAINNDDIVKYERHRDDLFKNNLEEIQSMIMSFCQESSNNGHSPMYLPMPDIFCDLQTFVKKEPTILMECLQHYPSQLRSLCLSSCQETLKKFDFEHSADAFSQSTDEHQYHIDLTNYSNLLSIVVDCNVVTPILLNLHANKLTCLALNNVSSAILPAITEATMLITLRLTSVNFTGILGCDSEVDIDLSRHLELKDLKLENILLGSLTLSPSVRKIIMVKIHTLANDALCYLLTSMSNTHSLEQIWLESVKCREEYLCEEVDGLEIDFSKLTRLRDLSLLDISAFSVALSPSIRRVSLRDINTLTYDGLFSLFSSISNVKSLEIIKLFSLKYIEHDNGVEDGLELDLSELSELSTLLLRDISPGSVKLSPSIRWLELINIKTLKHENLCSLASSISKTHSLEAIWLISVKCRDHVSGIDNGFDIDVSELNKLNDLMIKDISPGSVKLNPSLTNLDVRNIHTLTHDALWSLMFSISVTHSLERIQLNSVKCIEHGSGVACGYELDLSEHDKLSGLTLSDIFPGSVKLNSYIGEMNHIVLKNINTVSHDSMCTLTSNTQSSLFLNLESVRCIDYLQGVNCGMEIK